MKFNNILFRNCLWKMGPGAVHKVAAKTDLSVSTIYKLNSDHYGYEMSEDNKKRVAKAVGAAKAKLFPA